MLGPIGAVAASSNSVPKGSAMSGGTDSVPKDTVPKDTVPGDTVPKDTVPSASAVKNGQLAVASQNDPATIWASVFVGLVTGVLLGVYAAAVLIAERKAPFVKLAGLLRKAAIPLLVGGGLDSAASFVLYYTNTFKLHTSVVIGSYTVTVLALILYPLAVVLMNAFRWGRLSEQEKRAVELRVIELKDEKTCAAALGVTKPVFRDILKAALNKLDRDSN